VYIPSGEFLMGSSASEGDSDEHPQHLITLDAYWIQRTEVTNAQYARCVEAGGCRPPADGNVRYRDSQFAKQPVTGITWFQARDYAAWAGGRLPTEAEWEKACRGGLQIPQDPLVGWGQMKGNDQADRTYPWGKQEPTDDLLNYLGTGLSTWSVVGGYPDGATPYGALDMTGNLWEWTADWYGDTYYAESPKENPTGPRTGDYRVLRGGAFNVNANLVRCAYRYGYIGPDYWYGSFGFRVVVSPGL
jgi:formylglycine-generating enzyme required for sulfatase activity